MATTPAEFPCLAAVTPDSIKLFAKGSDTVAETISSVTQGTNNRTVCTGDIIGALSGSYRAVVFDASGSELFASYCVNLEDTTTKQYFSKVSTTQSSVLKT